MLDTYGRRYVNPLINFGAKCFLKIKLKPNEVTLLALMVGILAGLFIYLDKSIIAVITLWLSGYLDSVDGAMARESKKISPLGTLMDITFDRIVELTIILVLAVRFPESRLNLLILTMTILISMTIFLTVGALAKNNGIKSFRYQAGLAERSEGFIFLSLMIIFANTYLNLFINLFTLIIGITIFQRAIEAKKILK
ncbi:CDP-alcohol phosphatidyltransferase family protein [Clostridium tarantellae]|uniref:CDP-alcohol phosphatidyltransferase family protein n=1 Tax=Clostridium tarantellae TaxID=39493 RepID=A0A6I1MKL4_9CLOT|nr:CDP-alcohol phosphatidyltransferase family protein [Clostridium tarantellae]MPQ42732.1 CDP-alcohol phosphatidyltransferase family protein [Clostridium tarantellae]